MGSQPSSLAAIRSQYPPAVGDDVLQRHHARYWRRLGYHRTVSVSKGQRDVEVCSISVCLPYDAVLTRNCRYIEDFPLAKWVISHEHAEAAYDRMLFRERWRHLGTRIYDDHRGPGMNMPPMNLQRPLPATRDRFPHDPMPVSRQFPQMPPMPQMPNRAMPHVLPQQMLPSQPMAQPIPTLPNGMPLYSSHPMAMSGMVSGMLPHMVNMPMHAGRPMYGNPMHQMMPPTFPGRRGREKIIETPPVEPPVAPPPTPPYPKREKPTEYKAVNKSGRRNMRRAAEAGVFPWHRDIDFKAARANATWDDGIYGQQTLNDMSATRSKNEPIIEKIDTDESEKQRKYHRDKYRA